MRLVGVLLLLLLLLGCTTLAIIVVIVVTIRSIGPLAHAAHDDFSRWLIFPNLFGSFKVLCWIDNRSLFGFVFLIQMLFFILALLLHVLQTWVFYVRS